MNTLTPEDKKILRTLSRYLNSIGLEEGLIEFYTDDWKFRSGGITQSPRFSNSYTDEVPEFAFPVLDKIINVCGDKLDNPDGSEYSRIEIEIDTKTKIVKATKYWSYIEPSDTNGASWDIQEEEYKEELEDIFKTLEEMGVTEELILDYNGSGDSGYIENFFRGIEYQVPAVVENWCYHQLENLHGGWEINEGSEGYFSFDVHNKVINLEHTFNEEVHKEDTLFEESFDK